MIERAAGFKSRGVTLEAIDHSSRTAKASRIWISIRAADTAADLVQLFRVFGKARAYRRIQHVPEQ